jgi:hypothetical protein
MAKHVHSGARLCAERQPQRVEMLRLVGDTAALRQSETTMSSGLRRCTRRWFSQRENRYLEVAAVIRR